MDSLPHELDVGGGKSHSRGIWRINPASSLHKNRPGRSPHERMGDSRTANERKSTSSVKESPARHCHV